MFVTTSGTTILEGSGGELVKETRDGWLLNTQFNSNLTLGSSSVLHTKNKTNLAFRELVTCHIYVVVRGKDRFI